MEDYITMLGPHGTATNDAKYSGFRSITGDVGCFRVRATAVLCVLFNHKKQAMCVTRILFVSIVKECVRRLGMFQVAV